MSETLLRELNKAYCDSDSQNYQDFYKGFKSACDFLAPMLEQASVHVYASAGAEHMLDGFRPKKRPLDDFVINLKDVLGDNIE